MKKRAVVFAAVLVVLAWGGSVVAQEAPKTGGIVRVTQLVFESADVLIDGERVIEGLPYTLTSDYMALEAGSYTIDVAPSGGPISRAASATLEVADGHRYTLATTGLRNTGPVSLLVVDETAESLAQSEEKGTYAIIIDNVLGAPAVDVYFGETKVGAGMGFGEHILVRVPPGKIASRATLVDSPESVVFQSDYLIIPGAVSQASLTGDFTLFTDLERFPYERFALRSTEARLGDFLTAYNTLEASNLSRFYEALQTAGLLDVLNADGPFTVFAPSNAAFDAFPPDLLDRLMADPAALEIILRHHIVQGYYPSFDLVGEHTLQTLWNTTLASEFAVAGDFTLDGDVNVGLEHRAGNGVLYIIDALMAPAVQ